MRPPACRHLLLFLVALMLAGSSAKADTVKPSETPNDISLPALSTFQTPPPLSAEPPPKSFLGITMPHVKIPEMPSLPEMLSTVGALPERIGLPNANTVLDHQFDKLVAKLNVAIPAVETLGYEVRNFEVDWTVPPDIKVRLQSSEDVPDSVYEHVLASVKGDLILESIILSLGGVHKIQKASGLAPFKRCQLEISIAIPPHVTMIFTDPTNSFHDRFLAHQAALKADIAKEQAAKAGTPPPSEGEHGK